MGMPLTASFYLGFLCGSGAFARRLVGGYPKESCGLWIDRIMAGLATGEGTMQATSSNVVIQENAPSHGSCF
jgi:hypothetical protein